MGAVALPLTQFHLPHLGAVAHPQLCHKYPQLCRYIMFLQTPPPSLVLHASTLGQISLSWHASTCLTWPPMLTKIPLDIPKFEGKEGECPQNHIMMFHLWCSSNNIVYDSIKLRLFQCTLTGVATKWYIELPQSKNPDFNSLDFMFLQYFQTCVRYDEGVEILLSCC